MKSPTINRIAPLTSLRFFAAAAIVLNHSGSYFDFVKDFNSKIHIELGQGVAFFFVLSGFILTVIYSREDFSNGKTFFNFMRKRVARLWPLHVATLVLSVFLVPGVSLQLATISLWFNVLMLQSIVPLSSYYFSFNSISWSISSEFFFYLSLPILLFLVRRFLWLPLLAILPIVCLLMVIGNLLHLPIYPITTVDLSQYGLVYVNPLVRVLDFAFGVITAHIFLKFAHQWKLTTWQFTLLESVAVIASLGVSYVSPEIAAFLGRFPAVGPAGEFWLLKSGFSLISFSFLILMFAVQRGVISRFFCAPPLVLLGDISYAMYLCHMIALSTFNAYLPLQRSILDWVLCMAIILLSSHLLFTCIENPCRRLMLKEWNTKNGFAGAKDFATTNLWNYAFSARAALLATECLCLIGLLFLVLLQYQRHYIVSESKAKQIIGASHSAYSRKFGVNGANITCDGVIPNFRKGTVTLFWRASASADFDQSIFVELLDAKSNQVGNGILHNLGSLQKLGSFRSVKPGEVLICQIASPELRKAKQMRIRVLSPGNRWLGLSGGQTDLRGTRVLIPLKRALATKNALRCDQ